MNPVDEKICKELQAGKKEYATYLVWLKRDAGLSQAEAENRLKELIRQAGGR